MFSNKCNLVAYMKGEIFITFFLIFILLSCSTRQSQEAAANDPAHLQGTISISGAFGLYPISVKWAEEFRKIHPGVRFDISAGGAGKGISDALGGMVDL